LLFIVSILICHASWQRPPQLTRQQVDSILDQTDIPYESRFMYDVFLDSTRETDSSPYTYKYVPYERSFSIPKSAEEIKFEEEEKRFRSWREPAGWLLVAAMIIFARWAYKEMRRYNKGRLVVEDEEDETILYDMPDDNPDQRHYIN
jgi:hypothetical protein